MYAPARCNHSCKKLDQSRGTVVSARSRSRIFVTAMSDGIQCQGVGWNRVWKGIS